ncbi:hypothetical protein B1B04_24000 [Lysinibacillus sp. KCTC 33748]|nr:hypothetical protein B1B04_24000 [Lysinibacillus sp. KCTC 33748]SKC17577.1 hypothetical protein SAMN06295926_1352 [Lysinibacillus sp. AC-3]
MKRIHNLARNFKKSEYQHMFKNQQKLICIFLRGLLVLITVENNKYYSFAGSYPLLFFQYDEKEISKGVDICESKT